MSRLRQGTLKPAVRSIAAISLLVWLAALAFCSADCFIGDSHCEPGHHEQAASSHHDHDQAPEKKDGHDDSFCDSLKTTVHSKSNSTVFKPHFSLASTLSFVSLPQALDFAMIEVPIFRQTCRRDWVFTPEVCLGPALHSLAPPALA